MSNAENMHIARANDWFDICITGITITRTQDVSILKMIARVTWLVTAVLYSLVHWKYYYSLNNFAAIVRCPTNLN